MERYLTSVPADRLPLTWHSKFMYGSRCSGVVVPAGPSHVLRWCRRAAAAAKGGACTPPASAGTASIKSRCAMQYEGPALQGHENWSGLKLARVLVCCTGLLAAAVGEVFHDLS